jgi:hypothetical protein
MLSLLLTFCQHADIVCDEHVFNQGEFCMSKNGATFVIIGMVLVLLVLVLPASIQQFKAARAKLEASE